MSEIGDRMAPIALAFAVLELGGGATEVGLVLACRIFPQIATLLVGGVVADRVSRRIVMVVADVLRVLTQGLMAALLIAGAAEIWMLAVLAGLTGAAGGFFNPAASGVMPLIVPRELLQQANGLRATALSAGEIAGPVLAGLLIAGVGPGWALAVDAATFALSAVLLACAAAARPWSARRVLPRGPARLAGTSFRSFTWVWTFVLAAAVGTSSGASWSVSVPVVAERKLGGVGGVGDRCSRSGSARSPAACSPPAAAAASAAARPRSASVCSRSRSRSWPRVRRLSLAIGAFVAGRRR